MGALNDGYIGSSKRLRRAYNKRPRDFKRRILYYHPSKNYSLLLDKEQYWLNLINIEELGIRYYNMKKAAVGLDPDTARKIFYNRIENGDISMMQSTENNNKRVADGSHQWLGDKNPGRIKCADGTSHLYTSEYKKKSRERELKKVFDGSHGWLDKEKASERQKKLVREGKHHWLGGEIQKQTTRKTIEEGKHNSQIKKKCPYCNIICSLPNSKKYHFDMCIHNPNLTEEQKQTINNRKTNISKGLEKVNYLTCPYCSVKCNPGNAKRWHFDNCKHKP